VPLSSVLLHCCRRAATHDGSDRFISTLGLPVRFTHTQPPPPGQSAVAS
jgi:hypothetical protein